MSFRVRAAILVFLGRSGKGVRAPAHTVGWPIKLRLRPLICGRTSPLAKPRQAHQLESDASTGTFICLRVHSQALQMEGVREMLYTIVFANRGTRALSATDAPTAREALAIAEALQSQCGEIKYITSPQEGEFGVEMLRLLAKEEGEEMPIAPAEATNQGRKLVDRRPIVSKVP